METPADQARGTPREPRASPRGKLGARPSGVPPMKLEQISARHWHAYEIELRRPFGGALLHMLYPCPNDAKLRDGAAESKSIMRLLIEVERRLYGDGGYLPSDFHVGVCRKR